MPKTLKLGEFCRFIGEQQNAIEAVYAEIEEVQRQFNGIYQQKVQDWQATLSKGVPLLLADAAPPPALAQDLLRIIDEERAKLEKEIAALADQVREQRNAADRAIAEAQAELAALRQENPQLNAQEEEIKARCAALQQSIQQLEVQIKNTGFLTAFFQRRRLVRERDSQRQALAAQMARLRQVRQSWVDEKKRAADNQARLHSQFDTASIEAAQQQARLDYLQANLQLLSRQNGAGRFLAELKDVPPVSEPLRGVLSQMVELNRIKGEYEEGLRTVAEALGLLKGLAEGMDRFRKSADKVHEEQQTYNLRELRLVLSDQVLGFAALWPEFQAQVKDEKQLGTHPAEFSQRVQPLLATRLSDKIIADTFESLGDALTQATKAWG